jgi:peptidoglycan-associated lipoprotein
VTLGIAADRISVSSYGKDKLLDPTPGESSASRNRRVDFVSQ